MTRTILRHALTALPILILAAFASSPAPAQGVWDHKTGPRGNLFSPDQAGQGSPVQPQTPSMSRPSSGKNRERSKSLSPDVQKDLSLTDDQK